MSFLASPHALCLALFAFESGLKAAIESWNSFSFFSFSSFFFASRCSLVSFSLPPLPLLGSVPASELVWPVPPLLLTPLLAAAALAKPSVPSKPFSISLAADL